MGDSNLSIQGVEPSNSNAIPGPVYTILEVSSAANYEALGNRYDYFIIRIQTRHALLPPLYFRVGKFLEVSMTTGIVSDGVVCESEDQKKV